MTTLEAPPRTTSAPPAVNPRSIVARHVEKLVALGAFGVLCLVALTHPTALLEPDDYAYRASIIALSHFHLFLTNAQYQSLLIELSKGGGQGIAQWDHLANGTWISEKNPGYPFLAVVFSWLGILRLAPLFFGALGCLGLYAGGRRWLGRWGGTFSVVLFCTSGAAMAFAWRSTMPSFTDASLVAAGLGALLWAVLATEATQRRRIVVGSLAMVAMLLATFTRYTDLVMVVVAVGAIVGARAWGAITTRVALWWAAVVGAGGLAMAAFNQVVYGGPTKTGYANGEITFSFSAIWPNLSHMPRLLIEAMPVCILAAASLLWIGLRALAHRSGADPERRIVRRDLVVASAIALAWCGNWGLYLAYTWTAQMAGGGGGGGSIHLIRFYLPAIGCLALLGAWLLVRIPLTSAAIVSVALATAGVVSFEHLVAAGGPGGGGFPGTGGPGGSSPFGGGLASGGPGGTGSGYPATGGSGAGGGLPSSVGA